MYIYVFFFNPSIVRRRDLVVIQSLVKTSVEPCQELFLLGIELDFLELLILVKVH